MNRPLNADLRIIPADRSLHRRIVKGAHLVGDKSRFAQNAVAVGKANGDMFKRKVGAAVVAVRRAGAIHVFDSINHFFLINQMVIPGSSYWNIGVGLAEKDVEGDAEGMQTMRVLGQNMGWLMKKLNE